MESNTKNRQSDAVLRTLIACAFGDDEVPTADGFAEEITEGWFGSTSSTGSICAAAAARS